MPRQYIPKPIRREVIQRAHECCEYCLIHQDDRPESHQLDHILALKHGGTDELDNFALACASCNYHKGTDFYAIDPLEQTAAPLFNPRTQNRNEHFQLVGAEITGLTPTGRATVWLLRFNEEERSIERQELIEAERYPLPQII